jgi:hypothetical protein
MQNMVTNAEKTKNSIIHSQNHIEKEQQKHINSIYKK